MRSTLNCVYCLEAEAVSWSGYVKRADGEDLLAGWCKAHAQYHVLYGFRGHHIPAMGEATDKQLLGISEPSK